ncbi:hypothetical protein [Bernardetia sp.]|uniref:hypothetical protein n=1 Tax=Bernardetia sp. TaxID=1937974 RepID=UPI0025B94925|nr:hypothetical protein [Bernardetia sp.]
MVNYREILQAKKKWDAMQLEKQQYEDMTFSVLEMLQRIITFCQKDYLLDKKNIEGLKQAKKYFEEANFNQTDKHIKSEYIEELIYNFADKFPDKKSYSEAQKEELRIIVIFAFLKVSMLIFIEDFSYILSKEQLENLYKSLERLFSIIPNHNLLNSMLTLAAFTLDTNKKAKLIQNLEKAKKNIDTSYEAFYASKKAQQAGSALISHVIGDYYMQENRDLEKAKEYFEESLLKYKELAEDNPLEHLPSVAKAYKYLAHTYSRKESYVLAAFFHEQCLFILRRLYKVNPKKYDYDFSEHAFYMIGYHHKKIGDTKKAIELCEYFIFNASGEDELVYTYGYLLQITSFMLYAEVE